MSIAKYFSPKYRIYKTNTYLKFLQICFLTKYKYFYIKSESKNICVFSI